MYIVRLPVYPRVRRYLLHQYGPRIYSGEPNAAALLFNSVFTPDAKKNNFQPPPSSSFLGATYDFVMTNDRFHPRRIFSFHNTKRFNAAIDKLIRQDLWRWCQHPSSIEEKTDKKIRWFLKFYDFTEDELPFSNLKRWYHKEKKRSLTRLNGSIDIEAKKILSFF